jgi:RNA 2',3'-cyclic 3'-phosphodiesterase
MTPAGSVESGDRARLFCALRLPDAVLDALEEWQRLHVARGRAVPRPNLHITLAFLGWTPRDRLDDVVSELREAAVAARPIELEPVRYRETRSVGMLVLSDAGGAATALAGDLHGRLERLGVYEREARDWLPHLTVVRFRERPRLRPPLPETGAFAPSDAAVYLSRLRPSGAEYVALESVDLPKMNNGGI